MWFSILTRSCLLGVVAHWWPGGLTALAPPQWAAEACWTSPQTSFLWTHSLLPSGNIWISWFCLQISKSSFQSSQPPCCKERISERNRWASHGGARRFCVQMLKSGSVVKAQWRLDVSILCFLRCENEHSQHRWGRSNSAVSLNVSLGPFLRNLWSYTSLRRPCLCIYPSIGAEDPFSPTLLWGSAKNCSSSSDESALEDSSSLLANTLDIGLQQWAKGVQLTHHCENSQN